MTDGSLDVRLLALILSALPALACAAPPERIAVQYEMSYNGNVMAEVKDTLEHDGTSYRITSEGHGTGIYALLARGSVSRTSQGSVGAQGLRPAEFRDQRGDNVVSARFDWAAKTLVQAHRGETESQPLPERAQDRLSFLWNFAFVPPSGTSVEAVVADGRGAPVQYRYAIAGKELLKTPAGDIDALHLVKQRDAGDARGTEIWLDLKRDYVPVRILVVEKDGTRIDQVATRIGI